MTAKKSGKSSTSVFGLYGSFLELHPGSSREIILLSHDFNSFPDHHSSEGHVRPRIDLTNVSTRYKRKDRVASFVIVLV